MCALVCVLTLLLSLLLTFSVLASLVRNGCIYYLYVLAACISYAIWHCVLV